jgi:hypothetical protein
VLHDDGVCELDDRRVTQSDGIANVAVVLHEVTQDCGTYALKRAVLPSTEGRYFRTAEPVVAYRALGGFPLRLNSPGDEKGRLQRSQNHKKQTVQQGAYCLAPLANCELVVIFLTKRPDQPGDSYYFLESL